LEEHILVRTWLISKLTLNVVNVELIGVKCGLISDSQHKLLNPLGFGVTTATR